MWIELLISIIACASTTALVMKLLAPIAVQIALTDRPNARKEHISNVPLVGGLSIVIGFFVGIIFVPSPMGEFRLLFFGIVALIIVGMLDDHQDIKAGWKFLAQLAVASALVWHDDLQISHIGKIWGESNQGLGPLAVPLTVLAIVGAVNCVNMIDGHDGAAASLSIATLTAIALLVYRGGVESVSMIIWVFVTALSIFLVFNFQDSSGRVPKVFLGDAGSMVIGLFIAYFLVRFGGDSSPQLIKPVSAVWLIGVPLLDMLSVMIIRLMRGRNIMTAERSHIHHILLKRGLSKSAVFGIILGLQVVFVTVGITINFTQIPEPWFFWLGLGILASYIMTTATLSRSRM